MNRKRSRNAKPLRAVRGGPRSRKTNNGSLAIPQLRTNVVLSHRFRFIASSAIVNVGITGAMILGSCGVMGTVTNTTMSHIHRSFRIKSVRIWAPTSTSTTGATCSVEWFGLGNSPNLEVSDTSINVSRPAHLVTRPPANSLASFWQLTGATTIFVLNCPGGSVLDLDLQYIVADQTAATSTASGATVSLGVVYFLALDGTTNHLLVPVSLNTTF